MSDHAKRIVPTPLSGQERIHHAGRPLDVDVLAFWRWSGSDLLANTSRGILAEFLVATALDAAGDVRLEWASYDVRAKDGTKVEVKSAAYVQSWPQSRESPISFGIHPARGWDPDANEYDTVPRRNADVYVFCLLATRDSIDPLDVTQWKFFVLPTRVLDERVPSQKTIGLTSLRHLGAIEVEYHDLAAAIWQATSGDG